jgi:hypothetical protein
MPLHSVFRRRGTASRAVLTLLAAALWAAPLHAQPSGTPMQQAVDALTRALREKSFSILEPHLDDAYHVDHLTGARARQAMQQYVGSGMRVPTAVHVDSSWTDAEGQTRVSTRFAYPGDERTVVLVLSPAGRFIEVPLFRVQRIEGMTAPAARAAPSDPALQQELVRMAAIDQQSRGPGAGAQSGVRAPLDSAAALAQREADLANLRRLEEIVARHGWPGVSLVGEEGSRAAFLVLQHGDVATQERYLPLVKQAAAAREIAPGLAAMLEDRVLMQRGQPQIYGTQLRVDPATRQMSLWPVRDEAAVDQRRASVGLNPLAEYLVNFGIEYRPAPNP